MTLDQDKLVPTTLSSVSRENPAGPSSSSTSRKNSCTGAAVQPQPTAALTHSESLNRAVKSLPLPTAQDPCEFLSSPWSSPHLP